MKKVSILCVAMLMCLSLVACGDSKSKDDVKKTIAENSYKISTNVKGDTNNYYDENGTCYADGEKVECRRIIETERDNDTIEISKGEKLIRASVSDNKISNISYNDFDTTYSHEVKEKVKRVYIYSSSTGSGCNYFLEGDKDDTACPESEKEVAEKTYKSYTSFVEDMGLDEDGLMSFLNDYAKDEVKTIRDTVEENYKKQKALSNEEIKELLDDNYKIVNVNNSYMVNKMETDYGDNNFMISYDKNDSSKISNITYYNSLFSGDMGSDDLIVYIYYPQTDKEAGVSHAATCIYDLLDKKSISDEECSELQISSSELLRSYFISNLSDIDLTPDDIVKYFTSIAP